MNSKPTILYVDDDQNDVMLLRHAMRRTCLSLDLRAVHDHESACAYLEGQGPYADRQEFPFPTLVLLDLKMPRQHGFEILQWIRSQNRLCRLPVVILTASNHAPDIEHAYHLGANSYLIKPVDIVELVEMVRGMLSYWTGLAGLPAHTPAAALSAWQAAP